MTDPTTPSPPHTPVAAPPIATASPAMPASTSSSPTASSTSPRSSAPTSSSPAVSTSPRSPAPFIRPPRPGALRRLAARLRTAARLVLHFLHPARFILAPLLIVLLLAGILLSLTGGLAYVAPFVYTLF